MTRFLFLFLAFLAVHAAEDDATTTITATNSVSETSLAKDLDSEDLDYTASYLRRPQEAVLTSLSSRSSNKTACEVVESHDLPEECSCRQPGRFGVVVECLKVFNSSYFNDTIGMKINIDPCNPLGSRVSLDITEKDHNIDYAIVGIRAGEEKNYPIPGCSIIVPMVGHLGLDAAVLVYGNPDQLTLKIGLNACAVIREKELCASSIPGLNTILPWYVLSGTYSFGDFCNSTNVTTAIE